MTKNGKSEIDIDIKGHDIPYVTWVFIGVALLLIGAGIGASFLLRGGISMQAKVQALEAAVLEYQDDTWDIGIQPDSGINAK